MIHPGKSFATPTSSPASSTPATAPLLPRRGSTVFVSEESSPSSSSAASAKRLPGSLSVRPRPFSKSTQIPTPETSTVARTSRPRLPSIIDYEYYDEDAGILDVAPVSGKVKIHSDGYIECLDRGNFPHPFSCKKFISCAKMENGELLGWEYTCPRHLSFDPIGGICNWSAGLGCKEWFQSFGFFEVVKQGAVNERKHGLKSRSSVLRLHQIQRITTVTRLKI